VCVHVHGQNFSTFYNTGKLILLLLWRDTWFISEEYYTALRWIMQLRPGDGKWQLRWSLSSYALYVCIQTPNSLSISILTVQLPKVMQMSKK
jgi:hypothetical protein